MNHFFLLSVIYLAFISLGLPDGVLGVAWPAMRVTLGQPLEAAGLVTVVLTVCSAISSFASAAVLKRLGTGPVVMLSGCLTGVALLGFSLSPSFGVLLLLAVPLGLGAGAVDAGLNQFVAKHYSSRHMNWLHGCWGIGAMLGPVIMGVALATAAGWTQGYRHIAFIQMGLAGLFLLTLPLWSRHRPKPDAADDSARAARRKPLNAKAPWLAVALYPVYVSVEMGTGLWAATILVDGRGVSAATAGLWVSGYFGAIMIGRFATGLMAERLGNRLLVRYGLCVALAGAALFSLAVLPPVFSLLGLVLLGLGFAPIYPSLMHEAANRFDAHTARAVIGRQVAFAYVGSAMGPAALGLLAAAAGPVAIMPVVCLGVVLLLVLSEKLNGMT
jgi:fucose permease